MSTELQPSEIDITVKNDTTPQTTPQPSNGTTSENSARVDVNTAENTVSYTTNVEKQKPVPTIYQQSVDNWWARQKPVKEKNLKMYLFVSVIAIIVFFPIGLIAFYTAMKLREEFYEGLKKGDLIQCVKRAKQLDKLLILSFTFCVFTVILALAIAGGIQGSGNQGYAL